MAKFIREITLETSFWSHFDQRRTREMGGDVATLKEGFISLAVPAGSSHRENIERFARAAKPPFEIVRLSARLDDFRSIRGRGYFGQTGRTIDNILDNYPGMRWWMEKGGLVIDTVAPDLSQLSEFDRRAGKLVCDRTQNGKLSSDAVGQIAAELDTGGFILADNLQPAQWRLIADYNRKYPKKAIKNFAAAVSDPKFVRSIRRRLYVARDRYRKAHAPI